MQHNQLIEFCQWAFGQHPFITWIILVMYAPSVVRRVYVKKEE